MCINVILCLLINRLMEPLVSDRPCANYCRKKVFWGDKVKNARVSLKED